MGDHVRMRESIWGRARDIVASAIHRNNESITGDSITGDSITGDGITGVLSLRSVCLTLVIAVGCVAPSFDAKAQVADDAAVEQAPAAEDTDISLAAATVDVNPIAHDEEIGLRLQKVLEATDWFAAPTVRVEAGVVFLSGSAKSIERKKWATELARNTQGVVAVANRMEVREPVWDFAPARDGLFALWRDFVRSVPFLLFGLLVLGLSVAAGVMTTRFMRSSLRRRIHAKLLRNVLAGGMGVGVFLVGTYIVLRVSGLTQLALTVVGGTGLIGLAVGIAFRDITENFLASIFLSMQQPFATGDLVEITGITGYVQQLNVRTTVLMNLEGNLVQIPNASVYKNNIQNFTTNANRRGDFVVGIGYDDSINDAQEIALSVLEAHPAVLDDPRPSVLVDSLGKSTVDLRIYFWFDGREHSWLKVRSSIIRLVKRAYQQHDISMPDEAREIVFPKGVPVNMIGESSTRPAEESQAQPSAPKRAPQDMDAASTKAEAGLSSEAASIKEQARQAPLLQQDENLLAGDADTIESKR